MKTIKSLLFIVVTLFLFTTCSKEETGGRVVISVDNQSLFNESEVLVEASIVFFETDTGILEGFGRRNISEGREIEIGPIDLNIGNYYVRYRFFVDNGQFGSIRHQPFQVRAGEDTRVDIIL